MLLSPGFRSYRDDLVYDMVLNPAGIRVCCVPVFGQQTPENWMGTLHGIQEVVLQFLKLQYYRLWVILPAKVGMGSLSAGWNRFETPIVFQWSHDFEALFST